MKITEIWFTADHIHGRDEEGREYRQSLLWYPKLRAASDEERNTYTFGLGGIHWRELDEDISFESFAYEDSEHLFWKLIPKTIADPARESAIIVI